MAGEDRETACLGRLEQRAHVISLAQLHSLLFTCVGIAVSFLVRYTTKGCQGRDRTCDRSLTQATAASAELPGIGRDRGVEPPLPRPKREVIPFHYIPLVVLRGVEPRSLG